MPNAPRHSPAYEDALTPGPLDVALAGRATDDGKLLVDPEQLNPYHRNARRGNVAAIVESLRANGQFRAIVVNRGTRTGRPNEVLVGNHTLAAVRELGWTEVDVRFVDVDEDRARRIVLADNRTSDLATYDTLELANLLANLQDDYVGTGFDIYDVERIAESAAAAFNPDAYDATVADAAERVPRLDRTRTIKCPHCHQQFDSTAAIEVRAPAPGQNSGGRS